MTIDGDGDIVGNDGDGEGSVPGSESTLQKAILMH